MAKPSLQIVIKDGTGTLAAYVAVQVLERVMPPDPEKWTDEMALAVLPIVTALFAPPRWSRQAAAAGGAAMYPLMERLAAQIGIS